MSLSKIKIKMGSVEIEYEGSTDFLKQELLELVAAVSKLHKETEINPIGSTSGANMAQATSNASNNGGSFSGTTNEIAKKMTIKNGSDLIVAAAAKLFFVDGKNVFTNDAIRKEMNSATSFVTKGMKSNFAANLKSVVLQDRLKETGTNQYSIPAKLEDELRASLV